ncbi:MAG: dTDP-4-dehydrorhamnose 3,5-epimerase [Woeseiaceae bacterium]
MKFVETELSGVVKIEPTVFSDERGYFMETWQAKRFRDAGLDANFVQDNFSHSTKFTLRGLHYQIRQPQGKLVRVVSGKVFDVAVDIRKSSENFGQWVGAVLSEENKNQLWVPGGFAHGFLVLSETAEFEYKCSDYYAPEFERAIRWDDPDIGIDWPLAAGEQPVLSTKDEAAPNLREAETYA